MPELPPASYTLEYPYTRTTGRVVGRFLTALRDGQILGVRCRGRVLCPPLEFDPETGATLAPEFVPVGPGGRVLAWTWIAEPTRKHPFQEPFAFARKLGPYIRNVHLKDYQVTATASGYRLVRCALGEGVIDWAAMRALLAEVAPAAPQHIELAALYARHIRLFEDDWLAGFPARDARALRTC